MDIQHISTYAQLDFFIKNINADTDKFEEIVEITSP